MFRSASLVTVGPDQVPLHCLVCRGQLFGDRQVMLNTSDMEFLGLEWANRSGTALICDACGFVHTFDGDGFELWKAAGGYPR